MSDDEARSNLIAAVTVIALFLVVILWVRACDRQNREACEYRGGTVQEVHGDWFKWICVPPRREVP